MTTYASAHVATLLGLAALAGCAGDMQPMGSPMGSAMATPMAGPMSGSVEVGGAPMLPSRDIVDNAVNSRDHTTLVAAVQAAGLVQTLKGPGPFTVFAPTNAAFSALPPQTVPMLLRPENKAALTGVLTYHVVPGRLDFAALAERIRAGGGTASLTTANGQVLMAMMNGPHNIVLRDAAGNVARIGTYDVIQSNGVIHVIDRVLMPRS
jgi:uncharacterized surface protein with fasciclin (FAS1) repeats